MKLGKIDLEPIMDLYNREVIPYSIATWSSLDFALKAAQDLPPQMPKNYYQTVLLHIDQGWQYRHRAWLIEVI